MRKNRIDADFGNGADTVFYSVRKNRFYSYEQEGNLLHRDYGGEQYYESHTGLSGAGYLQPADEDNDLIEFGWYRIDARGHQRREEVLPGIFGYAPIASHGGITDGMPFVLTDGNLVAFVRREYVADTLKRWEGLKEDEDARTIPYVAYNQYGSQYEESFQLYNPARFRGVRATRFIDLRFFQEAASKVEAARAGRFLTLFEQLLNIVPGDGCWFHKSADRYFDRKWDENPRGITGEIIDGWIGAGDGLYWRRRKSGVQTFMEVKRASVSDGRYVLEGETSEYIDYEHDYSVLEWYGSGIEEIKEAFLAKITEKAREDYVYARTRSGVDTKALMQKYPDVRICIQDSLDAGNCDVGTRGFIQRFAIALDDEGYTTIGGLLENKEIDRMAKEFAFQKVIHRKLVPLETDTDEAEK